MSQPLPYDENKFDRNKNLEDLLNTPDDSDIGYFLEVDILYPFNIKETIKNFPFDPEIKIINPDKITKFLKENKRILKHRLRS